MPRTKSAAMTLGRAVCVTSPLAEDAVGVARAMLRLATSVLGVWTSSGLPTPGLLDFVVPMALHGASAAGGAAPAPIVPIVPLAVHAALRLTLAVRNRADLLLDPGWAKLAAMAWQGSDGATAALVADAAHCGSRHTRGPVRPSAPLTVHRCLARVQLAGLRLLERNAATFCACERGLRDVALSDHEALTTSGGATAPSAPLRDLADLRLGGRAGDVSARPVLHERSLALQTASLGMSLDAARPGLLRAPAAGRARTPHTPSGEDAILVPVLELETAPGLLQPAIARHAAMLCLPGDHSCSEGLLVACVAALAPQGPRAELAILLLELCYARAPPQTTRLRLRQVGTASPATVLGLGLDSPLPGLLPAPARLVAIAPVGPEG
mmetsp:Transcript_15566/g.32983  ORF Transcript_15566/g.32983 Transcript_15566/m.32983 type:complete len:382 (+) Transcript_15566:995-2140(+)